MSELYLQHHGILGQKWGVRRYQNADGTRTAAGKQRYSKDGEVGRSESKSTGINKETAKKVAIATAATLTVAALGVAYAKNKPAVDLAVQTAITKLNVNGAIIEAGIKNNMLTKDIIAKSTTLKAKTVAGKAAVDKVLSTPVGKGVKKVINAAAEGAGIMAGTAVLNKAVGKDTADDLIDSKNAYTKKDDRVKNKTVNDAIVANAKKVAKEEAEQNPKVKKVMKTANRIRG